MGKLKNRELEDALARLYFMAKLSLLEPSYKDYHKYFSDIFMIVEKWLQYYVEDNDLHRVSEKETVTIKKYRDSIPFDAYDKIYFEEVVNYIDIVLYYASCPINENFDGSNIIKKENEK